MEKYVKPNMEIVELENEVILTSMCSAPDPNEAPVDNDSGCTGDNYCTEEF